MHVLVKKNQISPMNGHTPKMVEPFDTKKLWERGKKITLAGAESSTTISTAGVAALQGSTCALDDKRLTAGSTDDPSSVVVCDEKATINKVTDEPNSAPEDNEPATVTVITDDVTEVAACNENVIDDGTTAPCPSLENKCNEQETVPRDDARDFDNPTTSTQVSIPVSDANAPSHDPESNIARENKPVPDNPNVTAAAVEVN